jgi:hypothetical protein
MVIHKVIADARGLFVCWQAMSRSSRMLNYINYRMRVTLSDG